jgi:hypothetical protein
VRRCFPGPDFAAVSEKNRFLGLPGFRPAEGRPGEIMSLDFSPAPLVSAESSSLAESSRPRRLSPLLNPEKSIISERAALRPGSLPL